MTTQQQPKKMPNRPDKTISWLNKSRNDWKDKTLSSKATLKVATQGRKRAEASRDQWKEKFYEIQADQKKQQDELDRKEAEIQELKAEMERLFAERDALKKSTGPFG